MPSSDQPTFPLLADDLLQAHPVPTFLIAPGGHIAFVNQAAEQLANVGRSALVGRPLYTILQLDSAQRQRLDALERRAYLAHAVELDLARGRGIVADLHMVSIGEAGHQMLTLSPVVGAGELLSIGNRGSGRSAAAAASILAHEIKNPLAGIRGAAQLIARRPDADIDRFTNLICVEVDRIAALIDRMQLFSRGQPLPCAAVNIYPAVQQVIDSVRAAHGEQINLAEQFDPSIPNALANHDGIVQILMNLIGNAVDALAGRESASIRVTTSYRHGLLIEQDTTGQRVAVPIEISVSDNGPGIDPELGEAVFEPFVTTKRDGQGLGLALVARLARDMGGAVQHRRIDGWTQFRLHLPAARKEDHS
ncbi:MAG: PAS domain-containing protein [Sphingopyxis sp.]|nr:PAS domain-containing protein [Sphingopyxis sp.]